jgi:transcription antitermination factor NusG
MVTVGPNMETPVSRVLDRLQLDHEWFRIRRKVIRQGKLDLRILPLFPGYIFLSACECCWAAVEAIRGVRGFVRFGGIIERIPERVLGTLRERAGEDGIINEDALPYTAGQTVFVRVGGQETTAVFRGYLTPARCLLDVRMFGRITSVQARLGDVKLG